MSIRAKFYVLHLLFHTVEKNYLAKAIRANSRKKSRSASGQAIAEGAAILVMFTMIFIGCLLLFLNTYLTSSYQSKLQLAATLAAQSVEAQKYWLGALRPDYNPQAAADNAQAVANNVLKILGMPPVDKFQVSSVPTNNSTSITSVELSLNQIPLLAGWTLPVPLSATSAWSTSETNVFLGVQLQFYDPTTSSNSQAKTVTVPAYAFQGTGGSSPVPGCSISPPSTCGFMAVNRLAPSTGSFETISPTGSGDRPW